MGCNPEDPDRVDDNCDYSATFAAKPKKSVDVNLNLKRESKQEEATAGGEVTTKLTDKTVRKLKINHGDCTSTYTFANDKMAFEATGKAVTEGDFTMDITGGAEMKQKKGEWKVFGKLAAKAKDLGGAKAALNVEVEHNQKQATTIKPKLNVEVNGEFNLGVSGKTDTKTFSEIFPQLVYKPADCPKSFYWMRGDITRQMVMAGCDQELKEGINHSFEIAYGYGAFKGIQGQPVMVRGGVEYELSDKTTVNVAATVSESYEISSEAEHKVDDHWTVSCSQSFDADKIAGKFNPYHIGFAATYKL